MFLDTYPVTSHWHANDVDRSAELLTLTTVEAFFLRQAKRPHIVRVERAKCRAKIGFAAGMIVAAKNFEETFDSSAILNT